MGLKYFTINYLTHKHLEDGHPFSILEALVVSVRLYQLVKPWRESPFQDQKFHESLSQYVKWSNDQFQTQAENIWQQDHPESTYLLCEAVGFVDPRCYEHFLPTY
jgi:hypothetical protein